MLKKTPSLSSRTSEPSNEEKVKTINELRHIFPLDDLLKICRIAKSSYYYGLKALKAKESKDKELLDKILKIYQKSHCRYGFKRITLVLNNESNEPINHKRVQRIMHELGIFGIQGKNGKYHSYKNDNGEPKENLLLEEEIDEEKHKLYLNVILKQRVLIKNGQPTYQNLNIKMVSFIYHRFLICLMVQ